MTIVISPTTHWRQKPSQQVYLGVRKTDAGNRDKVYYSSIEPKEALIDGLGGHYGYPGFNTGRNVGGTFMKTYNRVDHVLGNVGSIRGSGGYSNWSYEGSVFTGLGLYNDPPWTFPDNWGAIAYDRMKPDKPSVQGLNAIYELREVPEMFQQRFLDRGLNAIGDYYLALKFGWEPFLRDIRDFVLTQMNAQNTLKQLLRDEGKPVRRKIILADTSVEKSRVTGTGYCNYPTFVTQFYNGYGSTTDVVTEKNRVWASAQFRYWLPPGPRDIYWTRRMKAAIFGFRPTPVVVWNALPWTWLADWFTGIGHILSNMSSSVTDRCGADYFYVMRHSWTERKFETIQPYFSDDGTWSKVTVSASSLASSGCKTRDMGDPFGWGTPENSLSGVQLSILGALGLSRLR